MLLKIYIFRDAFFEKRKMLKNEIFIKNMGKIFSGLKIWSKKGRPFFNYRSLNLLFHFTDS